MSEIDGRRHSILVVEDNPADARLVRELLLEAGSPNEIRHVNTLEAAVETLPESPFSVVLLDLGLGDSQGLSTLLRLKARVPDLPIVVLTGLDDHELAVEAVRQGAQDYLVKGQLDGSVLLRSISYAIERKRLEQERNRLLERLRDSARDIFRVQEEERRRVAYELHDGLVQLVMSADMRLEGFIGHFRPRKPEAQRELSEISRQLKLAVGEGRSVLSQLRPSVLDDYGPVQALWNFLEDVGSREEWQWDLEDHLDGHRLDPLVATAIYRISQEALNNIRKHARAKRVKVSLGIEGNMVRLQVRDWGSGFDLAQALSRNPSAQERLGLLGMMERAQLLGGRCTVTSSSDGTTVLAEDPVSDNEAPGDC